MFLVVCLYLSRKQQENDILKPKVESVHEKRIREFDTQKTEFIALTSHQLRTPLTIIQGELEMLLDDMYGPLQKEHRGVISSVYESGSELVSLANSLLLLAKVEQGVVEYSQEDVDVVKILHSVYCELKPLADKKSLVLFVDVPESCYIKTDPEKLRMIVFNLLENACKYTQKGDINLSLQNVDKQVRICIKDTGCGFSKEEGRYLFHKFYRSKEARGRSDSSGLGLYMVRQFVEGLGGQVEASSPGKGMGSEFVVAIPKLTSD